jgi:hypothetical protein
MDHLQRHPEDAQPLLAILGKDDSPLGRCRLGLDHVASTLNFP